jgi:hypothetical protein
MSTNLSQRAQPATELIQAMTGSNVLIGTLIQNPVIIIFDNQSTSSVVISIGLISWKTFVAGEALVLDLRGNHGIASNFTFDIGTSFFGNGAATGSFSISYIYAQNT